MISLSWLVWLDTNLGILTNLNLFPERSETLSFVVPNQSVSTTANQSYIHTYISSHICDVHHRIVHEMALDCVAFCFCGSDSCRGFLSCGLVTALFCSLKGFAVNHTKSSTYIDWNVFLREKCQRLRAWFHVFCLFFMMFLTASLHVCGGFPLCYLVCMIILFGTQL